VKLFKALRIWRNLRSKVALTYFIYSLKVLRGVWAFFPIPAVSNSFVSLQHFGPHLNGPASNKTSWRACFYGTLALMWQIFATRSVYHRLYNLFVKLHSSRYSLNFFLRCYYKLTFWFKLPTTSKSPWYLERYTRFSPSHNSDIQLQNYLQRLIRTDA